MHTRQNYNLTHNFKCCILFSIIASLLLMYFNLNATTRTVYILGTGGTIAGRANKSVTEVYTNAQEKIDEIVRSVDGIDNLANLKAIQVFNKESDSITLEDWIHLANTVNTLLKKKDVSGIVITHGTDTIAETAYFLDLVVKSNKPVILTGAMRPATSISADGPINLFDSVAVAADKQSIKKGVMLVFGGRIYDARNVTKVDNVNVDAFSSPNGGFIGTSYAGTVKYYYNPLRKHTLNTPFTITPGIDQLPKVAIIYEYIGNNADFYKTAIESGVKGIVIAGAGNGSFNLAELKEIKKAESKGIKIVRSSRTTAGDVIFDSMDGFDSKYGLIPAGNLNPQKARILLMMALTVTDNTKKIRKFFKTF